MEIIRLNNLAASMVFSGKHDEAIAHLQSALAALRGVVNRAGTQEMRSCHHNIVEAHEGGHRSKVSPLTIVAVQDDQDTHEANVESAFQFYDKVFLVSPSQVSRFCSSSQHEKLQHLLLAVITYNLGNVSQRMGIKYGRSYHFTKAMRFYALSFTTIERILDDYGFDSHLILLLCSLYNNMGHIYARSNDIEETKFCLEWLQRTINAEEFSTCNSMCDEDYCFFSQYLMFGSTEQHFSSAPAA